VAALTSDFDGRRILDVTGPEPVTQDEIAAIAGEIAGRPVRHVPLDPADLRKGLVEAGLPQLYADVLVGFDVDAAEGYHAIATPTVKELTGREPASVRDFLTAQREALLAAA
jgi:NAD(P)H dehydrogenase (quinone)